MHTFGCFARLVQVKHDRLFKELHALKAVQAVELAAGEALGRSSHLAAQLCAFARREAAHHGASHALRLSAFRRRSRLLGRRLGRGGVYRQRQQPCDMTGSV